jgi:hypothetical protein
MFDSGRRVRFSLITRLPFTLPPGRHAQRRIDLYSRTSLQTLTDADRTARGAWTAWEGDLPARDGAKH